MAVDTPARIAVLGAGPIGLEAALYARFLGYEVDIYERGRAAENVLRWGHVRMFSPFGLNRSTLALAALAAQDAEYRPPPDDALLTGRQWAEEYLLPLARSDLLVDGLCERTTVWSISRHGCLKGDLIGRPARGHWPFRIVVQDESGGQRVATADVVIDATGTYGLPGWLGQGGAPALGEEALAGKINYHLPDIGGSDRDRFAGRHTLLVGAGYSAATSAVALAALAREQPGTRITWITRPRPADSDEDLADEEFLDDEYLDDEELDDDEFDAEELDEEEFDEGEPDDESASAVDLPTELAVPPLCRFARDPLPERDRLAQAANALAAATDGPLVYWPGNWIERIAWDEAGGRFEVELSGAHAGVHQFDRIVANVGYRPDNSLFSPLAVHTCYGSDGPMKLAAALAKCGAHGGDCLAQASCGPQSLVTTEPNFYILGAKSYGRNSQFLYSLGLAQIRELFTIIGDRSDLNLYTSIRSLLP